AQARGPRGGAGRARWSRADEGRRPHVGPGGESQGSAQARGRACPRTPRAGRAAQEHCTEAGIVTSAARVLELDDRRLLLNHLDEVLWPDVGVTKGDLIDYYLEVAEHVLPFVANRPVSLLRAPDPITGECVYQKTAPPGLPTWITTRRIRSEHAALGYSDYVLITERAALAYFVNLGYISIHPWSCTVDTLDRPDLLLFDLDPTEIAFREVRNAALLVRDLLNNFRVREYAAATVSTPLEWGELERPVYPEDFTLATSRERLARANDPLASFLGEPQSLTPLLESGRSRRARPMA